MSAEDAQAETDWQRILVDHENAIATYQAAYGAFATLIANHISYDYLTSPEILAEHRAREHLLAVRRRMNDLNPERAQAATLELGSQ